MPQKNGTSPNPSKVTATSSSSPVASHSSHSKQVDEKVDSAVHYEFGGPPGVLAMMLLFPVLMVYLWICVEFYGGILKLTLKK